MLFVYLQIISYLYSTKHSYTLWAIKNKLKKFKVNIIEKLNHLKTICLIRIIIFEIFTLVLIDFFYNHSNHTDFNKKEILSLLISVISIIIAIIITYLFSKLFAEKSERIQRKSEIDILSYKITAFRKIAFHIRGFHSFWKFNNLNIRSAVEHNYPNLTYEIIRGTELEYKKFTEIWDKIHGVSGQGYLALKGLENNEPSIHFFQKFNPKNYTLNEISRFKEYTNSFWYFLNTSDDSIVNFNGVSRYGLNFIDELYFEITGKQIDKSKYNSEIENLFSYFEGEIFQKHYYLTKLNSKRMPKLFTSSMINISAFVLLLISSLIVYISNLSECLEYSLTILITSLFIANTIDLMILTFTALKSELTITEFYKI